MIKRFVATLITAAMLMTCICVPVSADSVKSPYVSAWNDALKDGLVSIDYYEFSSQEGGYVKSSRVQVFEGNAYLVNSKYKISESLMSDDDIGFDEFGNVIYLEKDGQVYGILKNGNSSKNIGNNAVELEFNRIGFVVGYSDKNGNVISITSGTNVNTDTSSTWGGNTSVSGSDNWWENSSSGNNNNNNGANTSGNWWDDSSNANNNDSSSNTSSKYPFLTQDENGYLVYVESSSEQHVLYYADGHLVLNNLILSKNSVKAYCFGKNCVYYINSKGKLVKYQFGQKRQTIVASKAKAINTDNAGFAVSYTTSTGKTISI